MNTTENDNAIMINEWLILNSALTPESRSALKIIATEQASNLAQVFYRYMLEDKEAELYLSVEQVKERLSSSMASWIVQVLTSHGEEIYAIAQRQQLIGSVHARIGIPVPLVLRGMRKLKAALSDLFKQRVSDSDQLFQMQHYAVAAIDISSEMMTHAYALLNQTETKNEESYRLQSLISNVEVDRGKQQAALFNWENSLIYALVTGATRLQTYLLKDSEFGIWFRHKCAQHFSQKPEVAQLHRIINEIDMLLTGGNNNASLSLEYIQQTLRDIRLKTTQINNILSAMFEEASRLESGKDPLTNLLNRRFLPTVMKHEVKMAIQMQKPLVVAMVDVDNFKKINDTYGHEVGDRALRHMASLLSENMRSGDYLFRYGGEEFLIILVEANKSNAEKFLERIRLRVEQTPCELREGPLHMSVSIGFTLHGGHPDYEKLLQQADQGVYEAKRNGRNQVMFFGSEN